MASKKDKTKQDHDAYQKLMNSSSLSMNSKNALHDNLEEKLSPERSNNKRRGSNLSHTQNSETSPTQFRSIPTKHYDFNTTQQSTQYMQQNSMSPFKLTKRSTGSSNPFKQASTHIDHESIENGVTGQPLKAYARVIQRYENRN